jgi:hypothetical protein
MAGLSQQGSLLTQCDTRCLDIIVFKDINLLVHLNTCPALSKDQLPFLIENTWQTAFQKQLDHPDFK